jgi:pimeloyl-ACP methyl ester carboxylesterase
VKALVLSSTFARVFTPRGAYAARYVEQPIALAGMRWSTEAASRAWARRLARRNVWMFDPRCDEAIVELIRCGVRHVSLGMTRRCLSLAFAHDVRAELAGLLCPVLIVTGEIDTAFALAAADELAGLIPHARRATVPGAGHLHPLSHPEALSRIVTEWVADPR